MQEASSKPILTVGILADIQYAPIPDGHSYSGSPRYYRHSLVAAKHAANHFQRDNVDPLNILVNMHYRNQNLTDL